MIRQVIRIDAVGDPPKVETVGSFGGHLRQQREMRGVSLDEIVATTKIGRRLLIALEEEQFDLLPGGIFNRSYVRAYARCIGMDEEEAVAEYLKAAKEVLPDPQAIAQQHASIHSDRRLPDSRFPLVPVVILIVALAAAATGWTLYQQHRGAQEQARQEAPSAESSQNSSMATPGGQTAQIGGPSASSSTAAGAQRSAAAASIPGASAAGKSFEVTIRPREAVRVSVKADGKYVVRGIIAPPDVKTVSASSQIVFYTADAAAVDVSYNHRKVPVAAGASGEQTLVFDARGVQPRAAAP